MTQIGNTPSSQAKGVHGKPAVPAQPAVEAKPHAAPDLHGVSHDHKAVRVVPAAHGPVARHSYEEVQLGDQAPEAVALRNYEHRQTKGAEDLRARTRRITAREGDLDTFYPPDPQMKAAVLHRGHELAELDLHAREFAALAKETSHAEQVALAGLEPKSAIDDYELVKEALAHDPASVVALQQLLLDHGGQQTLSTGGQTVFHELAELAKAQRTVFGKGAYELLRQTVQDLADPAGIDQRQNGSCAATSSQAFLALTNPAEYARLVRGLAVDGKVQLAGGQTLDRDAELSLDRKEDPRTLTTRLLSSAFMDFADGPWSNYKDTDDHHHGWFDEKQGQGLSGPETAALLHALTGKPFASANPKTLDPPKDLFERVAQRVAANAGPVSVKLHLEYPYEGKNQSGYHQVLVTGIDKQGYYKILNPQGAEERLAPANLRDKLADALL